MHIKMSKISKSKYDLFRPHKLHKDIELTELKKNCNLFKQINNGRSGSKVFYFHMKTGKHKKRILKYNTISEKFLKEIYIHLDVDAGTKNYIPPILQFGLLTIGKMKYMYYISGFVEGIHIRDLYTSNIVKSQLGLRKLYIDFLKKYRKLHDSTGFHHMDIKSDNMIYDMKNNRIMLIDMGSSYTTKYPYTLYEKIVKKGLELPLKYYIYPFKNIDKTSFNYTIPKITVQQDKAYRSIRKLGTGNIDFMNIFKLYNTGIRMLFPIKKEKQIVISGEDAKMLCSNISYSKKIDYCIGLF